MMITIMILERDARREVLRRDVGAQRGLRAQRHAAGGGREAPSIINNAGSSGGRRRRVLRRRRGRGRCCGRWGERLDVLPTAQHAASTQRPPGHGLWEHERSDWLYCIRKGGTEEDEERKGSWKRGAEGEGVATRDEAAAALVARPGDHDAPSAVRCAAAPLGGPGGDRYLRQRDCWSVHRTIPFSILLTIYF